MAISAKDVQELRAKTNVGMMDCKRALQETHGNMDEAQQYLIKKGMASAAKKASRATSDGLVECYIHSGGRIGAMIELNCETDFVARTDDFRQWSCPLLRPPAHARF